MAKANKKLIDRIAERFSKASSSKSLKKVAFISQLEDIEEAIAGGWSYKNIYDTLVDEKTIDISYPTFCKYIREYIQAKNNINTKETLTVKPKSLIKDFSFDKTPNKDKLI